jgi:hypothetical protein
MCDSAEPSPGAFRNGIPNQRRSKIDRRVQEWLCFGCTACLMTTVLCIATLIWQGSIHHMSIKPYWVGSQNPTTCSAAAASRWNNRLLVSRHAHFLAPRLCGCKAVPAPTSRLPPAPQRLAALQRHRFGLRQPPRASAGLGCIRRRRLLRSHAPPSLLTLSRR